MEVAGFRGGFPRPPLLPLDPALRGDLFQLLEQAEAAVDGGTLPG